MRNDATCVPLDPLSSRCRHITLPTTPPPPLHQPFIDLTISDLVHSVICSGWAGRCSGAMRVRKECHRLVLKRPTSAASQALRRAKGLIVLGQLTPRLWPSVLPFAARRRSFVELSVSPQQRTSSWSTDLLFTLLAASLAVFLRAPPPQRSQRSQDWKHTVVCIARPVCRARFNGPSGPSRRPILALLLSTNRHHKHQRSASSKP